MTPFVPRFCVSFRASMPCERLTWDDENVELFVLLPPGAVPVSIVHKLELSFPALKLSEKPEALAKAANVRTTNNSLIDSPFECPTKNWIGRRTFLFCCESTAGL